MFFHDPDTNAEPYLLHGRGPQAAWISWLARPGEPTRSTRGVLAKRSDALFFGWAPWCRVRTNYSALGSGGTRPGYRVCHSCACGSSSAKQRP